MEYFLEASHLDSATAELLKKYDTDGDGSFSKDEVLTIILDLRRELNSNVTLGQANKILKRAIVAAIIFCLILMSSIFGLTYAVAALTAKLDVDSSTGVMTTPDGKHVVATDSVSYKVVSTKDEASGLQCLGGAELGELVGRVVNGNGVSLEMIGTGINGTQTEVRKLSGNVQTDERQICFMGTDGNQVCVEPSADCAGATGGRRLTTMTKSEYVASCLQIQRDYVDLPYVFATMVESARIRIERKCSDDIERTSPRRYKMGSRCVCLQAYASSVEFVFSVGSG